MNVKTTRQSVDAWLERFLRRDASLANPESTMGGQIERLQRHSMDSDGKKFVKHKTRPAMNVIKCRACGGAGGGCRSCGGGGEVAEQFGHEQIEYLVCKDDSAAHNAAHNADTKFADHGVDLMVWAGLDPVACDILWRQREPVWCPGGYETAHRHSPDTSTCEHEFVRALPDRKRVGQCDTCSATFVLDGKGKVESQLVCRVCELSQRTHEVIDERGKVKQRIDSHVRRVRIKVQRRLADRRDGDGTELIRPLEVDADGFAWMWHFELVRRDNEDIASELRITERQLRRLVTEARAQIAAKLGDEEPVVDEECERNRRVAATARWLAYQLGETRRRVSDALEQLGLYWGLLYLEEDADGVSHVRRRSQTD